MEKIATLEEIERHWSYDDLLRAISILDMREDMQEMIERKMK